MAVKNPVRPGYKVGKCQESHEWTEDSAGNLYCFDCNKMPFEVPANQAPEKWWVRNLKK